MMAAARSEEDTAMTRKTYHGSCHCKAVTFEVDLDLSHGTGRCNCTYCRKVREWGAMVKPEQFRLSGAENLTRYPADPARPNASYFCRICGIRTHGAGDIPELGGPYVGVQIPALDDATPEEIIAAPVRWMDGLNDDWFNLPAETRHL